MAEAITKTKTTKKIVHQREHSTVPTTVTLQLTLEEAVALRHLLGWHIESEPYSAADHLNFIYQALRDADVPLLEDRYTLGKIWYDKDSGPAVSLVVNEWLTPIVEIEKILEE